MYEFTDKATEEQYLTYLSSINHYNVMQRPEWAEVKNGWTHTLCLLYKDNIAVGGAMLLIRHLPLGMKIVYCPRGYVLDYSDNEVVEKFSDGVKAFAKKIGAYVVRIDPEIVLSEIYCKETSENDTGRIQMEFLKHIGYIHMGFDKGFHKYTQPRYNAQYCLLNKNGDPKTDEELLASYNRKLRKFVGAYTQKRGFTFEHSLSEDSVHKFVALSSCTEKRQHILQRDEQYFIRLKKSFKDDNVFFFAILDFDLLLNYINTELKNADGEEALRLEDDKVRANELKKIYGSRVITAAMNTVVSSDTAYFMYAGFNDSIFSRFNSTMQIRYEAMRFYRDMGLKYVNFMGIHGELDDSLAAFKLKFNPTVIEFAGEFELPVSKFKYRIMTKLFPVCKRIYIKLMLILKHK